MANLDSMPNLALEVLGIDLVQEMILNYAVRQSNGKVYGSNVSSLRLVQKSWLDSITKLLQKSKEPLFHLVLNKDNSLQERVGEDGKLVDRFLDTVSKMPSLPTFSVKILVDVFVQENHSSLSKMLAQFGGCLVQLELHIPSGISSLNFIFPNFTLPSLRKLSVKLTNLELPARESKTNVSNFINYLLNAAPGLTEFVVKFIKYHDDDDLLTFQLFTLPPSITTLELSCHFPPLVLPNLRKLTVKLSHLELAGTERNSNVAHFINSLLNAAPALTDFVIPPGSLHDVRNNPLAFQFFTLPPSITTLELSCKMTSENLELLVKSDLPKLTSLTLVIPGDEAYADALLFRILDKIRTTLRKLVLNGVETIGDAPRFVTSLRFPVMEKLEEFFICSINVELEPGESSLERFLPKLVTLALLNQTPDKFRKWTENSSFKFLCQDLMLHVANDNVHYNHPNYMASVDLEMMQSLHLAFPHVGDLNVTVSGTQVCGLKYLFMEMKTLRHLMIVVVGSTVGLDRDFWDALLIGVPINYAKAFRESIDSWEDAQLTSGSAPSIKNLRELTSFRLSTDPSCGHDPSVRVPLISDLTFLLALFQMPKLERLTLKGI